jgi:hypothetical protein
MYCPKYYPKRDKLDLNIRVKVNVNAKLSLCITTYHAMKTNWER